MSFGNKRTFCTSFSPEHLNRQTKRTMLPLTNNGQQAGEDISQSDILRSIQEAIQQLTINTNQIKSSVATLQSDVTQINEKLNLRMEKVESTIIDHANQIQSNKNEINRSRCLKEIVINGIPEKDDENLGDVFTKICKTLDYGDQIPYIFVRRLKNRQPKMATSQPVATASAKNDNGVLISPILVEFCFIGERKLFMQRYFKCVDLNISLAIRVKTGFTSMKI